MSDNNTYETETIAVLAGGGILLLFTAYLTRIYSDPSNYWTYTSAVYISWFLGFSGIILLPLDVAFAKTLPVEKNPLLEPWRFVFWTTLDFVPFFGVLVLFTSPKMSTRQIACQ